VRWRRPYASAVTEPFWHETATGSDYPHRAALALVTYELRRPAAVTFEDVAALRGRIG
jgi:hypothetical protein